MTTLDYILVVVAVLAGVMAMASGLIWGERRLLALFQDRYGPNRLGPLGLVQVLADMIKIFTKEDWVPPFADKFVFIMAPATVFAVTMISFAVLVFAPVPGSERAFVSVADINIGLLFFLAMAALGVYAVVLAGWSSNSKYSLLGALRGAAQMISYEAFMGLAVMGVVILAGSFRIGDIIEKQRPLWFFVPQLPGLIIFFIAGLASMHHQPLDLPESENELVAGYHSEYSGMKFAMFYLGEFMGVTLISAMTVTLFFGGYLGPGLHPVAWLMIKTLVVICFVILVRAALPRPRYDQLMNMAWKVLLPLSLVNLLVTGAVVLLVRGIQ